MLINSVLINSKILLSALLCIFSLTCIASDIHTFDNATQEAQYRTLITELRCPKCQNQNLASSDAMIAQDLKRNIYKQIKAGKTNADIRDDMIQRYGDFISYHPPVNQATAILWFFPPILLLCAFFFWFYQTKKTSTTSHSKLSDNEQKKLDNILSNTKD